MAFDFTTQYATWKNRMMRLFIYMVLQSSRPLGENYNSVAHNKLSLKPKNDGKFCKRV